MSIEAKPLAAASIGQVHRAVLRTPEGNVDVVVKVQRPGVGTTVARDLEILHVLAAALERAIPETRIYSPVGLVSSSTRRSRASSNFMIEADNATALRCNFAGTHYVRFPKVYRQASAKQVLTLEFFHGKKIDAAAARATSGPVIAKTAVGVVIKMIFEDGFFHADPHPGQHPHPRRRPRSRSSASSTSGWSAASRPSCATARRPDWSPLSARTATPSPTRSTHRPPTKKVDMRAYRGEVVDARREVPRSSPLKEMTSGDDPGPRPGGAQVRHRDPDRLHARRQGADDDRGDRQELDPDLDVFGEATPRTSSSSSRRATPRSASGNELLARHRAALARRLRHADAGARGARRPPPRTPRARPPTGAPEGADRLGQSLFAGLVVAAFVVAGTWLLATGTERIAGAALIAFGVMVMVGHAAMRMLGWFRK